MVDKSALRAEASQLAEQLFGRNREERTKFVDRLLDICTRAEGQDFLLIHNPGGWGSTRLEYCLEWERSVVMGVRDTISRLGYSSLLVQYFRSGQGQWAHMKDVGEQWKFFFHGQSTKVMIMAAELIFIAHWLKTIKIVLIGASQGAAFSNAVMRQLGEFPRVYSIELGLFFPHMSRRVITDRTLAIDNNGTMPDPMAQRDLWMGFKAYITAPIRWVKYLIQGKHQKFTYCVNVPGHDYNWKYPDVRRQIEDFLRVKFGIKQKLEVGIS
jgi:hypothetical protein